MSQLALKISLDDCLRSSSPCIVGVVNITPDSFSDGGKYLNSDKAIEHALQLLADGATWIELGAESTRPSSQRLESKQELERLLPVVEALSERCILAVDTYHAETAEQCLMRGVKIINDVSALRADVEMAKTIANYCSWLVLMHSKEHGKDPHATQSECEYVDLVAEVISFLEERIEHAVKAGIARSRIIIDPGMGAFLSPNPKYSFEMLARYDQLVQKFPDLACMVATSRKGFLGGALSDRDALSQMSSLIAVQNGAKVIRTHNVKMCVEFVNLWRRTHSRS